MPRKKKLSVEVVRSLPEMLARRAAVLSPRQEAAAWFSQESWAVLDDLVKQKVAEVLAHREDFLFEPHFQERRVSFELRRLMTVPELKKWSRYYDRWGCLRCGTKRRPHASHGYCQPCKSCIWYRLKTILKELSRERSSSATEVQQLTSRITAATRLLGKGEPSR